MSNIIVPNKKIITLDQIIDKKYENLPKDSKQKLHDLLLDPNIQGDLLLKVKKLLYVKEPPTPEEFLDPRNGWLKRGTVDDMFTWVRDAFIELMTDSEKYNVISFYGATRIGKSMLSRLIIYYTHIFINHLRDPQLYLSVSTDTNLCQYFICFNINKTKQLLMSPVFKFFTKSERAVRVRSKDQVLAKQKELGPDYFVYSTAATTGQITTSKNFEIQLGNDSPLSYIGADILQAFVTEIAFFIESEGASETQIFRLFTDAVDRMQATMGLRKKLAFVLLDSSANNADSLIEKHILNELQYQDDVYFVNKARWDVIEYHKKLFPVWKETGETFNVCTGDGTHKSKIIEHEQELEEIPKDLIVSVPIDAKPQFKANLNKSIKDIAGCPASNENRLIQDYELIDDLFVNYLPNIDGLITADSASMPQRLIWDQVYHKFFVKYNLNNYMLKRANTEPRFLHLDFAYATKGDVAGITCLHKERDFTTSETKYVTDFAFTIGPGPNEINLSALEEFIYDLVNLGHVHIHTVSADSFQNKQFEQNLKRMNINAKTISVDRTLDPYLLFVNNLFNRHIITGKNIFLKNNLKSLLRTRRGKDNKGSEIIDHTDGETNNNYYGDWENSECGVNAKDCSDSMCGALWSAYNSETVPSTDFIIENKKLSSDKNDRDDLVKQAYKRIHKFG